MDTYRAVKASFDRCGESDGFYDTFYDTFLAKSPDIPALFAHTDFTKQKLLLKATIAIMVRHRIDDERARQVLAQVAQTHNRSRQNINPELYRLWLDSLWGFLPNPPIGYIPEILRTNLTWEYPWWPTSK
jgi:Globin